MNQIITAKLKIHLYQNQKESLIQVFLAYRDPFNYASRIGFEQRKFSSIFKLLKLVYSDIYDIRGKIRILALMSWNFPRQKVANFYNNQWTKLKQNKQLIEKGKANKISKSLDKPIKVTFGVNCPFNYQIDFSFKPG